MGKLDAVAKEYMSRNDRFADAFNFVIYDGRQVIKPDELVEMDASEIAIPFLDKKSIPVQKLRDLLKNWKVMRDEKAIYVFLGIELQGEIHYAMPVRNILYDVLNYADQVKVRSKQREEEGKNNKGSAEFLSGYGKEDKLIPVITLTIYLGTDKWDGPKSLREMFGEQSEEISSMLPDYRLNLISPESIGKTEFDKFSTELGAVLEFIKYSKDKEQLGEIVKTKDSYKSLDRDTVRLLNEAAGLKIEMKEEEDQINMCQAIEEMKAESKAIGKAEGKAEGKIEGKTESLVESVKNIMDSLSMSETQAMDALKVSEEDRKVILAVLHKES